MTTFSDELLHAARQLARALEERSLKAVFAESCTAGLVSASLARIPGISRFVCGSAVVYQNETKTAWLGVSARQLDDPQVGPVSSETAAAMALGVLSRTPQADWSASVTGHLGPQAPVGLDGLIYVGIAYRDQTGQVTLSLTNRIQLPGFGDDSVQQRWQRQDLATIEVLRALCQALNSAG